MCDLRFLLPPIVKEKIGLHSGFPYTVETSIKEATLLDNSLLKALIYCLYNPYIRDGRSESLIKTCKDCKVSIADAFSPIIYFNF